MFPERFVIMYSQMFCLGFSAFEIIDFTLNDTVVARTTKNISLGVILIKQLFINELLRYRNRSTLLQL